MLTSCLCFLLFVFNESFYDVGVQEWVPLCMDVSFIGNGSRLYVTIQKHILNKVSPFVDLFFFVIHLLVYSSIAD